MSQIKLQSTHKVEIIESERGWGQKVEEVLYFKTEAEARNYAINYNEERWDTDESVPDWYMVARYAGRVS